MGYVVSVPVTPALSNSIEEFLHAVAHDRENSAELFIRMVDHLTDRMLSLFLVEPSRMIELSKGQQRVIDFAISTAGKASHMLTRQIYKKKTNSEFQPIAANLEETYRPAESEEQHPHMGFPVEEDFGADFQRAAQACMDGRGRDEMALVSTVMNRLTDEIIENFFVRNSRDVKIGYVTQKALDVGIDGSRKAIHAVTHKVLKDLNNEELKAFMEHYAPIVRQED